MRKREYLLFVLVTGKIGIKIKVIQRLITTLNVMLLLKLNQTKLFHRLKKMDTFISDVACTAALSTFHSWFSLFF